MPQGESFSTIVRRLQDNDPSLTYVSLHGYGLGDKEIAELAQALKHNTHAVEVNIMNNPAATALGVKALIDALKDNQTIAGLYVPPIGGKKVLDLGKALKETGNTNIIFFGINNGASMDYVHENRMDTLALLKKTIETPDRLTDGERSKINERRSSIMLMLDILEYENFMARRGQAIDFPLAHAVNEADLRFSNQELADAVGMVRAIAAVSGEEVRLPSRLDALMQEFGQRQALMPPSPELRDSSGTREKAPKDGQDLS